MLRRASARTSSHSPSSAWGAPQHTCSLGVTTSQPLAASTCHRGAAGAGEDERHHAAQEEAHAHAAARPAPARPAAVPGAGGGGGSGASRLSIRRSERGKSRVSPGRRAPATATPDAGRARASTTRALQPVGMRQQPAQGKGLEQRARSRPERRSRSAIARALSDELARAHAGGADGLAGAAVETVVHVRLQVGREFQAPLLPGADEGHAPARRLHLLAVGGIGGADGEAEPAADAGQHVVVVRPVARRVARRMRRSRAERYGGMSRGTAGATTPDTSQSRAASSNSRPILAPAERETVQRAREGGRAGLCGLAGGRSCADLSRSAMLWVNAGRALPGRVDVLGDRSQCADGWERGGWLSDEEGACRSGLCGRQ